MARAEVVLPDEFMNQLSRLGDRTDVIMAKALEAGGEVVLSKVRSNLQSVVGKNTKEESRSTGELLGALGLSPVKQNSDGKSNIKVGFAEPRQDGGSNAKIATILEYGKSGQPAKPFLAPAKSASKSACIAAMKSVLESEMS